MFIHEHTQLRIFQKILDTKTWPEFDNFELKLAIFGQKLAFLARKLDNLGHKWARLGLNWLFRPKLAKNKLLWTEMGCFSPKMGEK